MPANPGASTAKRVQFAPVEGAAALFTPEFQDYLVRLHDELGPRAVALRARRDERLTQALQHGRLPASPAPSAVTTGDWKVPPVPKDLATPGIEISGPCSITSMFINA
jgi:malate synthase